MPNGHDKNYRRLLTACAVYREKYRAWPTHARFEPIILQDLAQLLDLESFERLALHMELRSRAAPGLSVGGAPGYIEYGTRDFPDVDPLLLEQAEKWLGIQVRRDEY